MDAQLPPHRNEGDISVAVVPFNTDCLGFASSAVKVFEIDIPGNALEKAAGLDKVSELRVCKAITSYLQV